MIPTNKIVIFMGAPEGNLHNLYFEKDRPYEIREIVQNNNPFGVPVLYRFEGVKLPLKHNTQEEQCANPLYFEDAMPLSAVIKMVEDYTIKPIQPVKVTVTPIGDFIKELLKRRQQ